MVFCSYRGSVWPRLLVLCALSSCSQGLEIYRVSDPVPFDEDRESKNIRVSGDGLVFAYESDTDYGKTGLSAYADGVWNVWRTDMSAVFGSDDLTTTSNYTALKQHTLLSSPTKPSDKDAKYVALNHDGTRACYASNVPGEESIMVSTYDPVRGTSVVKYVTNLTATPKRDAWYCDVSADGKTLVFNSDAELVPGVNVTYRSDQIYLTRDDGATFTMITPHELALDSTKSQGAVVSGDGGVVAFRSTMQLPSAGVSAARDEAWMYRVADAKLVRITNFKPGECNVTLIYEKLVERWTQTNLTEAGVTKVTTSSCAYAATQGWIPGAGTVGMSGGNQPKMSDDGRFVAFASNFNPADTHGTKDVLPKVVAAGHLFLYDSLLGFTWQITSEGTPGPQLDADIEAFCCPGASSRTQRGTCSLAYEMKGSCCWQRPCWFPALNAYLSGDGNSIGLVGDMSHDGVSDAINRDLEIFHYHVPTSTFTPVTQTDDDSHDDLFPSLNYDGSVVGFTSDFDYSTGTPIIATNQVFAAKLAMGCSRDEQATNFLADPDVEVCCEFDDKAEAASGAAIEVVLNFHGNVADMAGKVQLTPVGEDVVETFCRNYGEQVVHDIACSLSVPQSHVSIVDMELDDDVIVCHKIAVDAGNMRMKVKIDATASTPPGELQSRLEAQFNDPNSHLWRAYLTKTLEDDAPLEISVREATIVNVAAAAGAFTTLLKAAEIAGLVDTLNGEGPFTVFAPTDEAFADVRNLDSIIADPEQLKTLLLNHVVVGAAVQAGDLSQGQRFRAAGGEELQVYLRDDGGVMINDSNVIAADVLATNGVIHVIDDVLEFQRDGRVYCPGFPFDDECNCQRDDDCYDHFNTRCGCEEAKGASCCNGYVPPKPVLGVAEDAGNFETLLTAVDAAGLRTLLTEDSSVTVFAPTDEAFAKVENLDAIIADKEALTQLLKNHVVLRTIRSTDLSDGSSILTAGGALLEVKFTADGKVMINNAQVTAADVPAYNGVIHVLDAVLSFDGDKQEASTTAEESTSASSEETEATETSKSSEDAASSEDGAGASSTEEGKDSSTAASTTYTSGVIFGIVALHFFL